MMKVASYNCQQSQNRALNFLTNTAADCDAACTQESGTRLSLRSYLANTPNFTSANAYLNDGCQVVTTTLGRVSKTVSLPIRAGKNENRSALLTVLRGSGLVVVNVHLTSGNRRRARSELRYIKNYLLNHYEGKSWVVIGDFNFNPTEYYPEFNYAAGPRHSSGRRLDWAMSNVDIEAHHYPRYHGSDHGPWYVDVDVD